MKALQWCVDKAGFGDVNQNQFEINGWIWEKNQREIKLKLL